MNDFTDKHSLIPLRNFFKNPEKISYKISPDGKYLSFLAPYNNRLNIFIQDSAGKAEAVRITDESNRDIINYLWGNNKRILYLMDDKGDENFHLFAVNTDGTEHADLTPFDKVTTHIIDELEDIGVIGFTIRKLK